jgi:hypothetical protein
VTTATGMNIITSGTTSMLAPDVSETPARKRRTHDQRRLTAGAKDGSVGRDAGRASGLERHECVDQGVELAVPLQRFLDGDDHEFRGPHRDEAFELAA